METIQATVGILTFNSAATLERALNSVRMFADILVGDGGSTDQTKEIAERFGARIIAQPQQGPIEDFSVVRNHLLRNAKYDWYFSLDADETVSEELIAEIAAIVQADTPPYVYKIPMGFIVNDTLVSYYSSYPGYQHRFFSRKSGAQYKKSIHEKITFSDQPVGETRGKWFVYWDRSRENSRTFNKYLKRDAALGADQPLPLFLRWKIYRNIRAFVYIALYTLWARTFHSWKKSAPLNIEWLKMLYKIKHIMYAVHFRYVRA